MVRLKLRFLVTAVCCVAAACGGTAAYGSGFGVFTQGASALGQADAVVAHVDGPSAVFFNPALIANLPGTNLEAGITLIFPHREYKDVAGEVTHTKDELFYPGSLYVTHTFNDRISAGLGVFNPFGLGTDWGQEWQGRYLATKSEVQSYNINPVVAWRITPSLSVAAGLDIVLLDATLENKIFTGTPAGDLDQKFKGDGNGVGYNVGIFLNAGHGVTLGASYRSEVEVDIDGSVTVGGSSFDAKTSLTLPQQVFAAVAYQATDSLVLETGMRWEDWSSFRQLQLTVAGTPSTPLPRDWRSTFAVNAGGAYRVNDMFSVMAGYLYGWNPVPDSTFEPAIPDADSHLFCLGSEARFNRLTVSLGYGYQLQRGRTKATNLYGSTANGSYESSLHLLAISLGYRF